jgi:hypothetical protein
MIYLRFDAEAIYAFIFRQALQLVYSHIYFIDSCHDSHFITRCTFSAFQIYWLSFFISSRLPLFDNRTASSSTVV